MNSSFIAGVQTGYSQGYLDGFLESGEYYHAESYEPAARKSGANLTSTILRDPNWQTSRVQQLTRFLQSIGADYSESTTGDLEMKL